MTQPPSFYASEYKIGKLSFDAYKHMVDAHTYGAAGSIRWLQTIVRELENCVATGGNLEIDQGQDGFLFISNKHAFFDWVKRNFPDAI